MENSNKSYSEVNGMFDVLVVFVLLVCITVSEVKDYRRKASEKREREEERAIIRKIKAEDKAVEDFKKYNVTLAK